MATISTHMGNKICIGHNLRSEGYCRQHHIDPHGKHEVWLYDGSPAEVYEKLFSRAVEDYNAKQKRADRRTTAKRYYQEVNERYKAQRGLQKNAVPPMREMLLGVYKANGLSEEKRKRIYAEFVNAFIKRYPRMKVCGVYYHADEDGEPHVHMDFVPVAMQNKRGLPVQVSMSGALREMGFQDNGNRGDALRAFDMDVNALMEDVCTQHGLTVVHPDRDAGGRRHEDTADYKVRMDALSEIEGRAKDAEGRAKDAEGRAKDAEARERASEAVISASERKAEEILADAQKVASERLQSVTAHQKAIEAEAYERGVKVGRAQMARVNSLESNVQENADSKRRSRRLPDIDFG